MSPKMCSNVQAPKNVGADIFILQKKYLYTDGTLYLYTHTQTLTHTHIHTQTHINISNTKTENNNFKIVKSS